MIAEKGYRKSNLQAGIDLAFDLYVVCMPYNNLDVVVTE
jgi:hypothetical protein